ncbi:MAG: hypothetical protein ACK58L_09170 [Planctomycetota bacterium]
MKIADADDIQALPQGARVAIVGSMEPCFQEIRAFLASCPFVQIVADNLTLSELFLSEHVSGVLSQPLDTGLDLVVVFQSSSDQYAVADIQRLIGRLMFGRIVCCSGPWCVSDGRTHDLWPVAFRIPTGSAVPILAAELEAFRNGMIPVSPLAAPEEVLIHRIEIMEACHRLPNRIRFGHITQPSHRDAVVISPDVSFRQTTCQQLRQFGFRVEDESTISATIDLLPDRFAGIIAVDLDACVVSEQKKLSRFVTARRSVDLVGLTGFPIQDQDRSDFAVVLEKTELCWQLSKL